MKLIGAALFFLFINYSLQSVVLTGTGYGRNESEAKLNALEDLARSIEVEVESEVRDLITEETKNDETKTLEYTSNYLRCKSNLPLIGVKYETIKSSGTQTPFKSSALMNTADSLEKYVLKIKEYKTLIEKDYQFFLSLKDRAEKITILNNLLSNVTQFNKYRLIALLLEGKELPEIEFTENQLKTEIQSLETSLETMEDIAKRIAKELPGKKIYFYPVSYQDISEVTDFSIKLKDMIHSKIQAESNPYQAELIFKGHYSVYNDRMELICILYNQDNQPVKTIYLKIKPDAFNSYQVIPKTVNFDYLLKNDIVVSHDFKIYLNTSSGRSNLLIRSKDSIELLVKANRKCYFYMIGYTFKDKQELSYLLEINDNDPQNRNRKFVYFINADDVNKWVSLGGFTPNKPYGIESIQVIASTEDLVDGIPVCQYDTKTGYYTLKNTFSQTIQKTRGFIRKTESNALKAEDYLILTTAE